MASDVRMAMGQADWSQGIDSGRVPLIASASNPNGLKPSQLAYANNCVLRGGCIEHRPGFEYATTMPIVGLMQGQYMFEPAGEFPYIVSQIAGRTFRTRVDLPGNPTDEITIPGDPNPATIDKVFIVQGEEFLVIQDGVSLPLFWDGFVMRRSLGPSRVFGVVNANFVVPAVGGAVLVTLTGPFAGANGDLIYINGNTYTTSDGVDFIDLFRNAVGTVYNTGDTVPAGTTVNAPSLPTMRTLAPFTVPLPGNTAQDVPVDSVPGGTAGSIQVDVNGDIDSWQIPATGLPPAGVNQVYLINLTDTPAATVTAGSNLETPAELPPAQAMDYYMGRIWLANGRQYIAGDIVGGPSGTAAYGYRDSILKMTENAYTVSGGAFTVPSNAGNIRALKHPANIDTALGEGQLLPMTRRNIYSTNVSPTRADWVLLKEPIQRVAQINFGTVSDRSVAQVNSDLYYRAVDGVRSFTQAIRYFNAGPGNTPISHEMSRLFDRDDRSLLRFCSAVEFDNRLLTLAMPHASPAGVAFKAIGGLNFDMVNSIQEKAPAAWEGAWEGLNFLQLLKGDFGGRQRCFTIAWSDLNQAIEIWEITTDAPEDRIADAQIDPAVADSEHSRITWSFETPGLDWKQPFELKQLDGLELWVDRLFGTVEFYLEYRPSSAACWTFWNRWTECAARNECELPNPLLPCNHPEQTYLPQYRQLMVMPIPPVACNTDVRETRPSNIDYSFQFRLTSKGSYRLRGYMAYAIPRGRAPFENLRCP